MISFEAAAIHPDDKTISREEILNPEQGLPMVHVASVAEMSDGLLAAVWYGGTSECAPDVKIYFSEREEHSSWASPRATSPT